ncbi:hypothetical protein [Staphylococcus warneri]|jgi:flagellar biosynthesis GTPase FlhF|uniref:hypothetical protein n=1 Tax=Staphylococcus warneri TaxID=1292 RepID=UPI000DCBF310|nr:hypothetical protein [Staphylococcus warneri]RAV25589.1 hypothetical protein DQE84_09435 [Staphylococcus warneri]RXU49287.1 hypothetical protein CWE31_00285 [Staphylococcus warneri]
MKRLVGILFASTLILGACSQDDTKEDENKKSESTTEKKANDKKDEKTKEDKKSKEEKKSQENEDNSTEEQHTEETATNEQVQSQEQQQTQQTNQQNGEYDSTKHSDEYNASHPVSTDDDWTPEEKQRYDEGMKEIERLEQKNQEMSDPTYDPNNPYINMPDQEWRNNTGGGLSSGEMQTRNAILNGTYEGDDAQQVLDAINYYEEKYSK